MPGFRGVLQTVEWERCVVLAIAVHVAEDPRHQSHPRGRFWPRNANMRCAFVQADRGSETACWWDIECFFKGIVLPKLMTWSGDRSACKRLKKPCGSSCKDEMLTIIR